MPQQVVVVCHVLVRPLLLLLLHAQRHCALQHGHHVLQVLLQAGGGSRRGRGGKGTMVTGNPWGGVGNAFVSAPRMLLQKWPALHP